MPFHPHAFFIFGAFFGLIAFIAGAFGSHALKNQWASERLQVYEVAVKYQMYHALALIALACVLSLFYSFFLVLAGWFYVIGTIIFSGSLYLLVWTTYKRWGAITPIGGVILLLGWLFLFIGGLL